VEFQSPGIELKVPELEDVTGVWFVHRWRSNCETLTQLTDAGKCRIYSHFSAHPDFSSNSEAAGTRGDTREAIRSHAPPVAEGCAQVADSVVVWT
jgi:hypothetical protein